MKKTGIIGAMEIEVERLKQDMTVREPLQRPEWSFLRES